MKIIRTIAGSTLLLGLIALSASSVQASPEAASTGTENVRMAKAAAKTKVIKEVGLSHADDTAKTAKPKPKPKPGPRDDGDGD